MKYRRLQTIHPSGEMTLLGENHLKTEMGIFRQGLNNASYGKMTDTILSGSFVLPDKNLLPHWILSREKYLR